jgi:hypothetical protein
MESHCAVDRYQRFAAAAILCDLSSAQRLVFPAFVR